jgi:hypothetical protein
MSRTFGSAALLAAAMVSAIGCYTISLKVSSERAEVDKLRAGIVADTGDIRTLQSELRTRARLPELQRWNDSVLALSPPTAHQFVRDSVMLASYAPSAAIAAKPRLVQGASATLPRVAPAVVAAPVTPQASQPVQPPRPLVPGIRQIAYSVGPTAPAPAMLRTAKPIVSAHIEPSPAIAKQPVIAGIDADLINSVEAAAGGGSSPARKAPMQ